MWYSWIVCNNTILLVQAKKHVVILGVANGAGFGLRFDLGGVGVLKTGLKGLKSPFVVKWCLPPHFKHLDFYLHSLLMNLCSGN